MCPRSLPGQEGVEVGTTMYKKFARLYESHAVGTRTAVERTGTWPHGFSRQHSLLKGSTCWAKRLWVSGSREGWTC